MACQTEPSWFGVYSLWGEIMFNGVFGYGGMNLTRYFMYILVVFPYSIDEVFIETYGLIVRVSRER